MMAICQVVGMEMNKRILEGARGEEIGHLWDRFSRLHFGHQFFLSLDST